MCLADIVGLCKKWYRSEEADSSEVVGKCNQTEPVGLSPPLM